MDDFLANLVLRILNPVQGVQPRLRTRFEPASAELAISGRSPSSSEPTPGAASNNPVRSSPGDQRRTPGPKPARTHSAQRSDRLENDHGEARTPHPTIRKEERAINGRAPASETTIVLRDAMHEKAARTFQPARQSPPATPKADAVPLPGPRATIETQAPSAASHPVHSDITVETEPNRAPDTVHITIGRVEVRALVQSKPQTVRRASTSALMTLDEYLTRRKGGSS